MSVGVVAVVVAVVAGGRGVADYCCFDVRDLGRHLMDPQTVCMVLTACSPTSVVRKYNNPFT